MNSTRNEKPPLVDFSNLDDVIQQQKGRHQKITTAPGQSIQNSLLRVELEKWNGANPVRFLDPSDVVRSKWSNRHELSFADEDFKLLKDDIENAGGNVQPIKVRPLEGQEGKYEVVFGHRRHQACLELGLLVLAMIADIDDRKMFVEMDRENRQRKDLRPYEQGLMYAHALDQGLFPSARKMAEATGVDLTNMGKALALARLPDFVIKAFSSPLELQYRWIADLGYAVASRPDDVEKNSLKVQNEWPRPLAKDVFERLVMQEGILPAATVADHVNFASSSGQKASIKVDATRKTISLTLKNIDSARAVELEKLIRQFLG